MSAHGPGENRGHAYAWVRLSRLALRRRRRRRCRQSDLRDTGRMQSVQREKLISESYAREIHTIGKYRGDQCALQRTLLPIRRPGGQEKRPPTRTQMTGKSQTSAHAARTFENKRPQFCVNWRHIGAHKNKTLTSEFTFVRSPWRAGNKQKIERQPHITGKLTQENNYIDSATPTRLAMHDDARMSQDIRAATRKRNATDCVRSIFACELQTAAATTISTRPHVNAGRAGRAGQTDRRIRAHLHI